MGVPAVNDDQKAIIAYVKDHFIEWMEEKNVLPFPTRQVQTDPQLLERMVRVEEAIKHQNEKFEMLRDDMNKRFDLMRVDMNNRFDLMRGDMNNRFDLMRDDMNSRFNRQNLYHLATFTAVIGSAVAVILKA